jgi:hypothetical protein
VSVFTIDVTPRKKAEARLALLARVGRMLNTSVESHLPTILRSVLDIIEGTHPGPAALHRSVSRWLTGNELCSGSVVADWSVLDVVGENGCLQRIATANAPTQLWQMHQLGPSKRETAEEERQTVDRYYRVLRLSNGDRVGIECGLPTADNFVVHVLHGHGRVYGTWLFVRQSSVHSEFLVPTTRTRTRTHTIARTTAHATRHTRSSR